MGLRTTRRVTSVAASLLAILLVSAGVARAVSPGVYTGGSPKADRYMRITLQLLRGGRRANWHVDVFGPCNEDDHLGRSVGTDVGNAPPDRQLRLKRGSFTLSKHATSMVGLTYSYTLSGHAVQGGFVGTFHYREHEGAYHCDSRLLRWRAHRTNAAFH